MTDISGPTAGRNFLKSLEIDPRLLGMIGAFIFIAVVFGIYTGGLFLSPRNIFNLTIQTVSIAIMATGMVFVIVTRHIDLSVGSMLAVSSAIMAMTQARWLPQMVGIPVGSIWIAPITIIVGLAVGTALGALTGFLSGYQGIPSFIVTLGGLLVWRNVAWFFTGGQTIAPLDANFLLFGGAEGVLGVTWSWVVGAIMSIVALWAIWSARKSKVSHGFAVKSQGAEIVLSGIVVGLILGFIAVLNAYEIPANKLKRMFESRGEVMPEGFAAGHGLPISVLLLIVVVIVMTVVAKKTRLGRYIFATGGNPDAAELSGINTKALTVKVFAIMGFLSGLSAVVAQARLQSHANDIGTSDELRVIAAAVIGGTALAGGIGTIYGAILGALIMQSLQSGMGMVGVDTPYQNVVVGAVLVLAVWIDIQFRKRRGAR